MIEYPEHAKVSRIMKESQAQGELLQWLSDKGAHLMVWDTRPEEVPMNCWRCSHFTEESRKRCICITCNGTHKYNELRMREGWWPLNKSILDILAEYHGIDKQKLEEEKKAILERIRSQRVQPDQNGDSDSV